jgi:hypothetical protein
VEFETGQGEGDPKLSPSDGSSGSLAGASSVASGGPESSRVRFRLVCSWCGEVLDAGDPGAPRTDTICLPCDAKFRAAEGLPLAGAEGVDAARRFAADECTAYLRGLGLEPLPGAVGL